MTWRHDIALAEVKSLGGSSSWTDLTTDTSWWVLALSLNLPLSLTFEGACAVSKGVLTLRCRDQEANIACHSIPVNGHGVLRLQHAVEVPEGETLHVHIQLGGESPWPATGGTTVVLHGVREEK